MKCFLKIGLALLFYLYAPCVYCQTSRFFSSDHLSSTMISSACIAQDSEGYIWIGTEYGLNRYDGYRFTCYPVKELKGFHRIHLKSGDSQVVTFKITADLLRFYDYHLNHVIEPGDFDIMIGPNSRDVKKKTITVL